MRFIGMLLALLLTACATDPNSSVQTSKELDNEAVADKALKDAFRTDAMGVAGIPESGDYADKIRKCIQPGVKMTTSAGEGTVNPTVSYVVRLNADGTVTGLNLKKYSGIPQFDEAVAKGIKSCNPFPKPSTGSYPPDGIEVIYAMYDVAAMSIGVPIEKSKLPPCQGTNSATWNMCTGSRTFNNGVRYVGEFKGGSYNGQGTYTRPDGTKYVGEFKDDRRDGQGALTHPDGTKYVGEFKYGKPNGQGTFTLPDGSKYVGEFKDGMRNGQGTHTFPDGSKYVGQVKDGKPNGLGTYTFLDGKKYVGEFKDGQPNGQGTVIFPDGKKYVGEFKDGKMNGQTPKTVPNPAK